MAESIGFEPMRPFRDDGLANRCLNHSANSPNTWCDWPESNRHARKREILSLLCLPISPQSQF